MSAHVNGESGPAVPGRLVDPASGQQEMAGGSPRRPVETAVVRPATNGRVIPAPSSAPAVETVVAGSRPLLQAHAGVVTRLLAAALDAVIVVVLTALIDLAAAGARFLWSPMDFRWPRPTAVGAVGVLLLVAVVYLSAGWALTGRTYGARLIGLRVLSSRHQLLGWPRSILRAVISVLWPVGLLWCAISRTRSSVADLVLRTVVVYDAEPYASVGDGGPPRGPQAAS